VRCSLAPAVLARAAYFLLCAIIDRSHNDIV
jgi:hypothetical protein